jgi:hypothetical protein
MTEPLPGSRWRATTTKHDGWEVVIRKLTPQSIGFQRRGRGAPPGRRHYWMARPAFLTVFAPVRGESG